MSVFVEKCAFFVENANFERLIKYYARKLKDPHAELELWGFLWIVKNTVGDKPDRYYAVCLRNEFIRLSKAKNGLSFIAEYWQFETQNFDNKIAVTEALKRIPTRPREVLILHYYAGFSIEEIARFKGVSRQAVNKQKNNGLELLRVILLDKKINAV